MEEQRPIEGWWVAKHPDREVREVVWIGMHGTAYRAACPGLFRWQDFDLIRHLNLEEE